MKIIKFLFVVLIVVFTTTLTAKSGAENDGRYLAFAEVMPQPIGGIGAIIKLIKYPLVARNNNIQGKVYVLAYINENGIAEDVKVVKGIGAGCDEAAIEAAKKAKYSPGQKKGKNVKVKLTMAITFKLK